MPTSIKYDIAKLEQTKISNILIYLRKSMDPSTEKVYKMKIKFVLSNRISKFLYKKRTQQWVHSIYYRSWNSILVNILKVIIYYITVTVNILFWVYVCSHGVQSSKTECIELQKLQKLVQENNIYILFQCQASFMQSLLSSLQACLQNGISFCLSVQTNLCKHSINYAGPKYISCKQFHFHTSFAIRIRRSFFAISSLWIASLK